jgi:hypothetical protein
VATIGDAPHCWVGLPDDAWRLLVAWRSQLSSCAVFTGLTAAWLHRLDVDPIHPVEVAVPADSGIRSRAGLVVRRRALRATDVVTVRALRATTIDRTLRDLRPRMPRVEFLVLADAALRLGLGRFDERAAPAESPMETRLRCLLMDSGLPIPEVQADLRDPRGRSIARVDLYYRSARLVIEFDGGNHRERLVEDDRRQNALIDAGFRVLRYTASDFRQRPDGIVAEVRRAVGA